MLFRLQRLASWPVLSALLGTVLLVAIALKGYEIATEELHEDSLLSSRWFLILLVEWEIFFALWLLGGFYRFYPRATWWVALLYFFALFVVAADGVLKGGSTCPCFGKAVVPPWLSAAFDLTALAFLAAVPTPSASCKSQKRSPWVLSSTVFAAFGLLSLITMGNYSTAGAIPNIRRDPRLYGPMTIERVRPTTEEILALGKESSNVNLIADEKLLSHQPDYGVWDLKSIRLWAVMEMLVRRQIVPARWEKVEDGYAMVPAAPFGKSPFFWIGGMTALALSMLGLRWLEARGGRKELLPAVLKRRQPDASSLTR